MKDQAADAGAPPPIDGAPAAAGSLRWVRSLSSLQGLGVADGAGGLVVTGYITAPANLGGQALVPVGGPALVVAGFDADTADHLYSVRHGDEGSAFPFLSQVAANGSPIVYGVSYGTVDLGKGQVPGGSPGVDPLPADGYIGVYGPAAPSWVARIVGPGEDKIVGTAPGPGSTIYGAGWFEATPAFNNATLTGAGGRDGFLARFNSFTGAVELTRTYGGTSRDEISSAGSGGNTFAVAGFFGKTAAEPASTLAFGGTAQPLTAADSLDVWIAKLDDKGDGIWAVRFGGDGDDRDPKIVVDAAGDIYVAGSYTSQIGFGAINLPARGDSDVFLTKLNGSDGSVAWAVSLATPSRDTLRGIAVDGAGHVVITGSAGAPLDGGSSPGVPDAYIASYSAANGALQWRKVIATAGDDSATAVAFGRNGELYALVGLGGAFDFGMPVQGAAGPTAVLLRIVP